MRLEGKVSLVTGGGSGIGEAIAREFHAEGARVAIAGRDFDALKQVVAELGDGIFPVPSDITETSALDRLYQKIDERWGRLDILVANAGTMNPAPLPEVTEELFDQQSDINFRGTFFTVQRALNHLNDGASIILVTSTANRVGVPGNSVYSATKAAVRSLARSFAAELMERRIRVNALSPGFVDTPIFERSGVPEEIKRTFPDLIPMGRLGHPTEIAKAALFLASEDSSYVTGIELSVGGGLTQL